jgi:hypothetical protein
MPADLRVGDRVTFWWTCSLEEGGVAAIHGPDEWSPETVYEVTVARGINRVLYGAEIVEIIQQPSIGFFLGMLLAFLSALLMLYLGKVWWSQN